MKIELRRVVAEALVGLTEGTSVSVEELANDILCEALKGGGDDGQGPIKEIVPGNTPGPEAPEEVEYEEIDEDELANKMDMSEVDFTSLVPEGLSL